MKEKITNISSIITSSFIKYKCGDPSWGNLLWIISPSVVSLRVKLVVFLEFEAWLNTSLYYCSKC